MRARPIWQPAQNGVMLFTPGEHASIHKTQEKLSQLSVSEGARSGVQSQAPNTSDTILLPLKNGRDIHVRSEPTEFSGFGFSRDDSPATLDDDWITVPKPESTPSRDLGSQLEAAAAGCFLSEAITPSLEELPSGDVPSLTEGFVDVGYDTERTDFQEDTPSPSLRRATRRRTARQSHYLRTIPRPFTTLAVARRLDFTRNNSQAHKNVATTQKQKRGAVERIPSHKYTSDERELLCILYRFYHSEDVRVIPKIFNAIAGLNLRHHTIRKYFWDHMYLYGPESFQAFSRVLSVPFNTPQDCYTEIIPKIERLARDLNLDLQRRRVEVDFVCGKAKKSSSSRIRKNYDSMVEKTKQEAKDEATNAVIARDVAIAAQSLDLMSRAIRVPFEDHIELFTDVEKSSGPTAKSVGAPKPVWTKPHLTFRVWDAENRTAFIDGGFVAQAFVDWPCPFPAPIALDDPSDAGKILTVLHLSKHGDTPVYISTASSLIQALSYATSMQQPKIALISLDAECLQREQKVHHAGAVFTWLKSQGLAQWARYKGLGEYFIWSNIPSHAVLCTSDVDKLISNLNSDIDCRELLDFDVFAAGVNTSNIAAILREKSKTLNTASARALGKIARAFGMAQSNMTLRHLQDLLARLFDGWTILKPDMIDVHTMSSLAAVFATALGSHNAGYTLQEVMSTFIDGVDDGTRCIAHWSRSRSGSRRQRFRAT